MPTNHESLCNHNMIFSSHHMVPNFHTHISFMNCGMFIRVYILLECTAG